MVIIVARDKCMPAKATDFCGNRDGIGLADEVKNFTKRFCKNNETPMVVIKRDILEDDLKGL